MTLTKKCYTNALYINIVLKLVVLNGCTAQTKSIQGH